jgi:hypothetical protein
VLGVLIDAYHAIIVARSRELAVTRFLCDPQASIKCTDSTARVRRWVMIPL